MMPLSLAHAGEPMTVVNVRAGRRLRQRLIDLGPVPGAMVEVMQSLSHGPVILAVGGSRLVLGRGASHKVPVKPGPSGR